MSVSSFFEGFCHPPAAKRCRAIKDNINLIYPALQFLNLV